MDLENLEIAVGHHPIDGKRSLMTLRYRPLTVYLVLIKRVGMGLVVLGLILKFIHLLWQVIKKETFFLIDLPQM